MAYTWNDGEDLNVTQNVIHLMLKSMVTQDVCRYFNVKSIHEITREMITEVLEFEKGLDVAHPLRLGIYAFFYEWQDLQE